MLVSGSCLAGIGICSCPVLGLREEPGGFWQLIWAERLKFLGTAYCCVLGSHPRSWCPPHPLQSSVGEGLSGSAWPGPHTGEKGVKAGSQNHWAGSPGKSGLGRPAGGAVCNSGRGGGGTSLAHGTGNPMVHCPPLPNLRTRVSLLLATTPRPSSRPAALTPGLRGAPIVCARLLRRGCEGRSRGGRREPGRGRGRC